MRLDREAADVTVPDKSLNPFYLDKPRPDILAMIPADGTIIGSIGCNTGATEAVLVKEGRTVWGVDVNSEAIEVASQRLQRAWVIDASDPLPFPEDSLDGMILADVLEHMPQAWTRLRDLARCVHVGGWVVISVPNMRSLRVAWFFGVRGDWPEHPEGVFDSTHIQVMSARRLERWCEGANLTIDRRYPHWDGRNPASNLFIRVLNVGTLGLLRSWLMLELQVRCRRVA